MQESFDNANNQFLGSQDAVVFSARHLSLVAAGHQPPLVSLPSLQLLRREHGGTATDLHFALPLFCINATPGKLQVRIRALCESDLQCEVVMSAMFASCCVFTPMSKPMLIQSVTFAR